MRYAFILAILCVCSVVRGQDAASSAPSVLNHGQPTPATAATSAPAADSAPAASPTPVVVEEVVVAGRCRNGRCCTGPNCRLYNVEESVTETCRPRLFGGYVKTNTARTVYRPSRR